VLIYVFTLNLSLIVVSNFILIFDDINIGEKIIKICFFLAEEKV
jgi:hypothetical protein